MNGFAERGGSSKQAKIKREENLCRLRKKGRGWKLFKSSGLLVLVKRRPTSFIATDTLSSVSLTNVHFPETKLQFSFLVTKNGLM